ncbi:MAG TPA: BatD family protein [Syntrophales bacterium]|nr:BatD family protein [Syntrophales bacterium]
MIKKIFVPLILVVLLSVVPQGLLHAATTLTLAADRDEASLNDSVRLKVSDQPTAGQAGNKGRGNLFLTAVVSPKEAYHEQEIIYTLKLFYSIEVSDVSVSLPKTKGLTFRQPSEPRQYRSKVKGQNFDVLEVNYLLTAAHPGTYTIEPANMAMTIYDPSRRSPHNFSEDLFFGFKRGRPVSIPSEPMELTVLQLPQEDRPVNFSGLVGKFRINASCDPTRLKAGDSSSLTVQLTGRGNINRIPDLSLPEIPGLKVYADQTKLEIGKDSHSNTGTKTMKWAIVSQRQGTYTIPSLRLSYFDTETRSYKTLATHAQTLTVWPGEERQSQPNQLLVAGRPDRARLKLEVETLGHDILPIHTSIDDIKPGLSIQHHTYIAIIILLIPGLACLSVVFFLRHMSQSAAHASAMRAKRAFRVFASTLSKEKLSASQILEIVRVYINERFDLAIGLITPEEMSRILAERRVNPNLVERLHAVLDELQHVVYTGRGDQTVLIRDDMVELILQIDQEAQ